MEPDASKIVEPLEDMLPDTGREKAATLAAVSIAISLKRIADALDVTPTGAGSLTVRDILSGMEMNTRGAP